MKKELCLYLLIAFLSACDGNIFSNCKENYNFHGDYYLDMLFIEKQTGRNLLVVGVNRYNRDTVDILDKNLNPFPYGHHPYQDGRIFFNFMQHFRYSPEPLNTPIDHTYYIYFEEGDYDTLDITYQIGLDQCEYRVLTQWAVSYNDSLYFNYPTNPPMGRGIKFLKTTTPPKR